MESEYRLTDAELSELDTLDGYPDNIDGFKDFLAAGVFPTDADTPPPMPAYYRELDDGHIYQIQGSDLRKLLQYVIYTSENRMVGWMTCLCNLCTQWDEVKQLRKKFIEVAGTLEEREESHVYDELLTDDNGKGGISDENLHILFRGIMEKNRLPLDWFYDPKNNCKL